VQVVTGIQAPLSMEISIPDTAVLSDAEPVIVYGFGALLFIFPLLTGSVIADAGGVNSPVV